MRGEVAVVVGTFFGDEGKAKIVDFITHNYDYVVRYQGGDNAGHSVYINGKKYTFQIVPCGILRTKAVISHGVVINPEQLFSEIDELGDLVNDNLYISKNIHIICSWNIAFDRLLEKIKGASAVGTTLKGIGPTYSNKALRLGLRAKDLLDLDSLREKIKLNLDIYNVLFEHYGEPTFDLEFETNKYYEYGQRLKSYLIDSYSFFHSEFKNGKKFLLEGSQGIMLDLDLGTYPFVTSSNIIASASSGTSMPFSYFKRLIGVVKAYSSRVGNGSFITELTDERLTNYIRQTANEFGSVTGRPRRIGWLDLVALKYSVNISGITELALTLVDVLNGLDEVKVCINYDKDSNPEYKAFKGWKDDYSKIKSYLDFSKELRDYLEFIEFFIGVKITIISYGKERDETFIRIDGN
ncbi:adenylosuccinate synthase [Candidatus Mycoplasma haematobovis]|nr:adenylosuccinate synthase [Candidatus Mycoplasma haematobovis]